MNISAGLTDSEVQERRRRYGSNALVVEHTQSAVGTFLSEFKNPLIVILLVAAAISLATGSTVSGFLIIVIILVSAVLDFVISFRSQRAAQTLSQKVSPKSRVFRNGGIVVVSHEEIVPDDIVILSAGSVVPADGTVATSGTLFVNEAALTGESLPVEKPEGTPLYMGSGVVSGDGEMKVTAIGTGTKFASVVKLLSEKEQTSKFEQGIASFSGLLMRVILILCACIFVIGAVFRHDLFGSLIFALALAVGMTPDLLPMIIAVNLSRASIHMARRGVIVKRLSAIENFGSMDILCTDKTGTLTEDKITVVKYLDVAGETSEEVLEAAYVSSYLRGSVRSPLDTAIIERETFAIDAYKKMYEIPFDFERRRDSTIVSHGKDQIFITKGAPEAVMEVCDISEADRARIMPLFESLSAEGYRVISVATKVFASEQTVYSTADEHGLTFIGFIAFLDPAKKDVYKVIQKLSQQSIEIKVITGDHRLVTEHILKDVGLVSKGVLDAHEIDTLTDDALRVRAEQVTIFSRVTPIQKNRIISALQKGGHTVGYMGDGINDAPALRTADVGISVDNAVDVAKESADIVLTTKDIDRIVQGVTAGRKTFVNTQKYISMAISSNFGNMLSMTVASVSLPFLPMLPPQILLNNLLYESSQMALITDHVEEHVVNRPRPWNISYIKRFMILFGALSSLFDFAVFFLLYKVFHLNAGMFQTGWFIESITSQVFAVFFIRTGRSVFKVRRPHAAVILASSAAVIAATVIALSKVGSFFQFVPVPPVILATIMGITITYFIAIELVKKFIAPRFVEGKR